MHIKQYLRNFLREVLNCDCQNLPDRSVSILLKQNSPISIKSFKQYFSKFACVFLILCYYMHVSTLREEIQ